MREIKRLKVLTLVEHGNLTRDEAAQELKISERQLYRIQKAFREKGEQGLIHRNCGKPSPRQTSKEVQDKIKTLLDEKYSDYNTLHFQEILSKTYGVEISYSTLQSIRRKAKHPTPRAKKSKKHRGRRPRRPIYGMMLQADASIHPWLEDRGPKLALIALIDDATNKVWGTFRAYEDAAGYLEGSPDSMLDHRDPNGALY